MKNLNVKIRTSKAPAMRNRQNKTSSYRELFNSMSRGHWFTIDSCDYKKFQNAGQTYVKGRYSLYKHPTMQCKYVFMLNK